MQVHNLASSAETVGSFWFRKIAELNCFVAFTTHQKKSEGLVDDVVACNDLLVKRVEPFNSSLMIRVLCDKKREPYAGVNEYHVQFP